MGIKASSEEQTLMNREENNGTRSHTSLLFSEENDKNAVCRMCLEPSHLSSMSDFQGWHKRFHLISIAVILALMILYYVKPGVQCQLPGSADKDPLPADYAFGDSEYFYNVQGNQRVLIHKSLIPVPARNVVFEEDKSFVDSELFEKYWNGTATDSPWDRFNFCRYLLTSMGVQLNFR